MPYDASAGASSAASRLSHGILPSALARYGLAAAVEDVVDGLGLPLTVTVASDRFRPEIESNVYFVVAEALTNMSKHARAQSGAVTISAEEHVLHVDVRDDGVGGAAVEGGIFAASRIAWPRSEAACGSRALRAAARGSPPRSRWSGERPRPQGA